MSHVDVGAMELTGGSQINHQKTWRAPSLNWKNHWFLGDDLR